MYTGTSYAARREGCHSTPNNAIRVWSLPPIVDLMFQPHLGVVGRAGGLAVKDTWNGSYSCILHFFIVFNIPKAACSLLRRLQSKHAWTTPIEPSPAASVSLHRWCVAKTASGPVRSSSNLTQADRIIGHLSVVLCAIFGECVGSAVYTCTCLHLSSLTSKILWEGAKRTATTPQSPFSMLIVDIPPISCQQPLQTRITYKNAYQGCCLYRPHDCRSNSHYFVALPFPLFFDQLGENTLGCGLLSSGSVLLPVVIGAIGANLKILRPASLLP